ncbi:MAG: LemA family protein [Candidatus Diapherotrites archaeon]|nr:LemA family protein [Candidatus Diapherotrites archaeon]
MIEWILLGIIVILVLGLILVYNGLIGNRNRVENAWSQIDVQLKRRFDLIPNLIESVKGYAKHEKDVFTEVTKARAAVANATGVSGRAQAENMLTGALKSLFAVAEAYPQLRASENFQQLQEELSSTESKIAYARQFYNDAVLLYNNAIQQFPSNVIAGMFGFAKKDFFEAEAGAREAPKVKF